MNYSQDTQGLLSELVSHYETNINNRFVRKALLSLELDNITWSRIERAVSLTQQNMQNTIDLEEMYSLIFSLAKFISLARKINLGLISAASDSNSMERTLRNMAVSNFGSNINHLADLINSLYLKVRSDDESAAVKGRPVYEGIPELQKIGSFLIS
jgi:hypothetical protein